MKIVEQLEDIEQLIDTGYFSVAGKKALKLMDYLEQTDDSSAFYTTIIFNTCSYLIDSGANSKQIGMCLRATEILKRESQRLLNAVQPHQYYYNLANGLVSTFTTETLLDCSFKNIETLVEAKNLYWKTLKESQALLEEVAEYKVNLANCLKRQFRISESLAYYDDVIESDLDIPQAHVNKSESLKILNRLSGQYSHKMTSEVAKNYFAAAKSIYIPSSFAEYYLQQAKSAEELLPGLIFDHVEDEIENEREFLEFSEFRKFCCREKLTLTIHGLYCSCYASIRDDLSIFTSEYGLFDSFTTQMEQTLNRVKSEYSLAREHYFSYANSVNLLGAEDSDVCYSKLANGECLGVEYEKLRTSFRLCFGILDKIAFAIAIGYGTDKSTDSVYFHNFWRLDSGNRREVFERIKSPGLLALYSIATDLNQHKDGEWSQFRDWRNALEHGSFVLVHDEDYSDPFESYSLSNGSVIVPIKDFDNFVRQMLYLTRSAIFSFVFAIKDTNNSRERADDTEE